MFVLGIESATPVAGVAVVDDSKILAERMVNNQRTHSVNLLPMVKAVIEEAGLGPGDIQGVAVSTGPGSFTGLRIGMSTAKTLAQVWGVPIVGVGTLDALAFPLTGLKNLLCPILNARKNEVYAAIYDVSQNYLKVIFGPSAVKPEMLADVLRQHGREVTFLGDGVPVYGELLKNILGRVVFAPGAAVLPRGAAVAELGALELKNGRGVDPLTLLPNYIRLSEAETRWVQKQQAGECGTCS